MRVPSRPRRGRKCPGRSQSHGSSRADSRPAVGYVPATRELPCRTLVELWGRDDEGRHQEESQSLSRRVSAEGAEDAGKTNRKERRGAEARGGHLLRVAALRAAWIERRLNPQVPLNTCGHL